MELNTLISKDLCRLLESRTKTEVLLELMELADTTGSVTDVEGLKREIFYREQLMSTGIGQQIGIPHVRFAGIREPMILVGVSPDGIPDYESLDGKTVTMVFMILVGEDQHKEYLRILSLLVHRLKDERVTGRLRSAANSRDIYAALVEDA